jgi:hypothetical protein
LALLDYYRHAPMSVLGGKRTLAALASRTCAATNVSDEIAEEERGWDGNPHVVKNEKGEQDPHQENCGQREAHIPVHLRTSI